MSGLSPFRRAIKLLHPEGIPGLAARFYNALSRTSVFQRHYDLVAQDILRFCEPGLILDIGTGPGWLLLALHRHSPRTRLVGLDISPAMVRKARANIGAAGFAGSIEVKPGSADHLPFVDGSFDAVVSTGSIHHWKDPQSCLSEIHRVLRHGGHALIYDVVSDTPKEVMRKASLEFGRLRTTLLWLHSYEEPFYAEGVLRDLALRSPFRTGTTRFVGVLCRLNMQKQGIPLSQSSQRHKAES